jgi:DNA-binding SARP family transcriptional activator/tetratricopeptide (TPR) repeat protein
MVEFRMLGSMSLRGSDGRELRPLLAQPKRLALLAYLAASPRFHRRDSLVALFWPDLDQEHARGALRQALHGLRRALGDDAFRDRGDDDIGLDPGRISCDVVEFERAAETGQLAEALELYRGDLLEGFFIRGAPEFEHWLEDERARLKGVALLSAGTLAEQSEASESWQDSAQWAGKALRLAPLDERSLRQLMRMLDRLGNRAGALEAYEGFARRLATELEADPAPETQAIAEAIRERFAMLPFGQGELLPLPTAVTERPVPAGDTRFPRPWLVLVVAGLGVAAVVAAVSLNAHAPAPLDAKRVLVIPFINRTGDASLDPLGNLAADWITRGLALTAVLEIADPGAIVLGGEIGGAAPAGQSSDQASDAGARARASNSGMVVWGSLYRRGEEIEFDARITDVQSGSVLRALEPVLGDPLEPRPALSQLRERIMSALAEAVDPRLGASAPGTGEPPRYPAYVAFQTGVDVWYRGRNAAAALPYFRRAAGLDSGYALPLIWAAWAHAGSELDQCDSSVAIAGRLRTMRLTRIEQLQIDRVVARCRGDLAAAYQLARALAEAVPRSELMWEQLARDALDFERPREAVEILGRLHPDSAALRGRASYYNWLTSAHHLLGRHDREIEAARHARRLFPSNLAVLRMELLALSALGRGPEVIQRFGEIDALPNDPLRRKPTVMREIALDLAAHGDSAAAGVALDRTLAWLASRPAADQATEYLRFERALTLFAAGHADSAREISEELARTHPQNPQYVGLLGVLLAQRGEGPEAIRLSRQLGALGRPLSRGQIPYWRACIAAQLGRRAEAVDLLRRARAEGYVFNGLLFLSAHLEPSFAPLRDYPPFQELLRPKG